MLTRLKVSGFKNLIDVDVSFGPFTCIAGVNGVGKSNLFDAIEFLSALADRTLRDAALSVRSSGSRASDVRGIFTRFGDRQAQEMAFEAEMLVPQSAVDDLGQEARAAITFLRYRLKLVLRDGNIGIEEEELEHLNVGEAHRHLLFDHRTKWRKSVLSGRRTSAFISTIREAGGTKVVLHQDQGEGYKGGGKPRRYVASSLPRTVLSTANAAESATAVVAKREMQSWRLLQLEPTALRSPDDFTTPRSLDPSGAHLPATLARLAHLEIAGGPLPADSGDEPDSTVYERLANRLAELIEGVDSLAVEVDERRELLTLVLRDRLGTKHEARSLSDGTLRFLALAVLEADPEAQGMLCLEEPENGIHPRRIPAMLTLLQDFAVDPDWEVDDTNPLRQVVVNTHSPLVAASVPQDCLLVAVPSLREFEGRTVTGPEFLWLPGTWREKGLPTSHPVPLGEVLSYLNPIQPLPSEVNEPGLGVPPKTPSSRLRNRVVDHPDLQPYLPVPGGWQ